METTKENQEWTFEPAGNLDAEQQAELEAFMNKIVTSCEGDDSLPVEIGQTVQTWLKELKDEKQDQ